jgi:hypothetical protein
MIRIKFFSSFSTNENCRETFERLNNSCDILFYGKNKKYYFVNDDNYTHAIIINTAMPNLTIPKDNVIGIAFEPIYFLGLTQEFIDYAKKYISKYYIGDKFDLPEPFIEHFGYMWYSKPPKEITIKLKLMSIIVSEKCFSPGHNYRHLLVQNIINNNLPIDIYGRGSVIYNYNTIKGIFNDSEPYEEYMFSICIENFVCNHYFSEKIISPLMYNCNPIYFGCKNINLYLENYIELNGNIIEDLHKIVDIINNPLNYYKKTYTEKNLENINLTKNLPRIFP